MIGRVVRYRDDKDLNLRALVVKAKDDSENSDLDLVVVYPNGKLEKPMGVPHLSKLLKENNGITRRQPGAHWRY